MGAVQAWLRQRPVSLDRGGSIRLCHDLHLRQIPEDDLPVASPAALRAILPVGWTVRQWTPPVVVAAEDGDSLQKIGRLSL